MNNLFTKSKFLILFLFLIPVFGYSQAFIQIVNNSPDEAMSQADFYVNGQKMTGMDNLEYRKATSLTLVSPGSLEIVVAGSGSQSSTDLVLHTQTITNIELGKTYVIFANGIVNSSAVSPIPNRNISFNLEVMESRAQSSESGKVQVAVMHGATDVPAIDIYTNINSDPDYSNLNYPNTATYKSFTPLNYVLTVTAAANKDLLLGTFQAPIAIANNQALVVFASGVATINSHGVPLNSNANFGLFAVFANGTVIALPAEEPAYLQIIHNVADPVADQVDIYLGGVKPGYLDDFSFREATPYLPIPVFGEVSLSVNESLSENIGDKLIKDFNLGTLEKGSYYTLILNGVVQSGFPQVNSDITLTLLKSDGKEKSESTLTVDAKFVHGVTDIPAVDIKRFEDNSEIASALMYNAATEYSAYEATSKTFSFNVTASPDEVGYGFFDFSTIAGKSAVILASGFAFGSDISNYPGLNEENMGTKEFAFLVVDSEGGVSQITMIDGQEEEQPFGFAQFIHNSPLQGFETVDIYINGLKQNELNDFSFRSATPYIPVPANIELVVKVALPDSENENDKIVSTITLPPVELMSFNTFIAYGVTEEYSNPFQREQGVMVKMIPAKIAPDDETKVELNIFHGVFDAPAIDLYLNQSDVAAVSGLEYGKTTGYLEFDATSYILDVHAIGDENIVARFNAPLTTAVGNTGFVFASGFLTLDDEPGNISSEYGFGLYVALGNGMVIPLPQLPTSVNKLDNMDFKVYPNPTKDFTTVNLEGLDVKSIEIKNILGKTEKRYLDINKNSLTLYLDDLPNGQYVLLIETNSGIKSTLLNLTR